ncbi:hypothetical protein [Sphingobacterium gobiense]|uniref:hypothetical protein n=1 Tax=Sphingobacterium gobiense TaxID=1382456 RepID=UPI0015E42F9B|nr:hypothetical protein [Sphingobacterium gobiense]
MKTTNKMQYVARTLDVCEIELEQGIAAGSATPSTTPQINDYGNGSSVSTTWSDDQF